MKEIWKDIIGYEGYYQISNLGNVRSLDRIIEINEVNRKYKRTLNGRILKQMIVKIDDNLSYYRVQLKHKGNKYYVHRLVAMVFIKNDDIINKTQVNHKDLNGLNNHISNLEWVTPSENVLHGHYTRNYWIKPISLMKNGVLYHFKSQKEAKEAGASAIDRLVNGIQKSTNGWSLPI